MEVYKSGAGHAWNRGQKNSKQIPDAHRCSMYDIFAIVWLHLGEFWGHTADKYSDSRHGAYGGVIETYLNRY